MTVSNALDKSEFKVKNKIEELFNVAAKRKRKLLHKATSKIGFRPIESPSRPKTGLIKNSTKTLNHLTWTEIYQLHSMSGWATHLHQRWVCGSKILNEHHARWLYCKLRNILSLFWFVSSRLLDSSFRMHAGGMLLWYECSSGFARQLFGTGLHRLGWYIFCFSVNVNKEILARSGANGCVHWDVREVCTTNRSSHLKYKK